MKTQEQLKRIEEYTDDIADYEKAVNSAEKELTESKEWLMKQKVYHAEAIIKLHNYLKEITPLNQTQTFMKKEIKKDELLELLKNSCIGNIERIMTASGLPIDKEKAEILLRHIAKKMFMEENELVEDKHYLYKKEL